MENSYRIDIEVLSHARSLPLPGYQTPHSSGVDLLAAVENDVEILPGKRALVPTGLRVALPPEFEFQVRPRSGLALRHGLTVLNSPGTIDADYRGEIQIILANLGDEVFTVTRGMRIAQMVLCRVNRFAWNPTNELSDTVRGSGGFGHTGHTDDVK